MTEGFGDRVKADALKRGDKISTLGSVPDFVAGDDNTGPRVAANDNTPLTVTGMLRDNNPTRVYNFEVESREGESTHNYFVGDNQASVHNAEEYSGKVQEIMNKILEKEKELLQDKCNLPNYGPGPDYTTRQGHRRLIAKYWKFFYRALGK